MPLPSQLCCKPPSRAGGSTPPGAWRNVDVVKLPSVSATKAPCGLSSVPGFRLRNVVSPVLMSTIATAPAVGGFFATVQSNANAGTASTSAVAQASRSAASFVLIESPSLSVCTAGDATECRELGEACCPCCGSEDGVGTLLRRKWQA